MSTNFARYALYASCKDLSSTDVGKTLAIDPRAHIQKNCILPIAYPLKLMTIQLTDEFAYYRAHRNICRWRTQENVLFSRPRLISEKSRDN